MVNRKTNRFYWLNITQDLFDNWCLHKVYGGLHNHKIHNQYVFYDDKISASQAMFDIEVLRRRHGYVYADTTTSEDYILTPEVI